MRQYEIEHREKLEVHPLHGAQSIHIIVPAGVEITVKDNHSHNSIFYMDGFTKNDCSVPDFSNIKL